MRPGCPRLDRLPGIPLPGGLRLARADSWRTRLIGLAGLDSIPRERGLLLAGCRSVHTFGMRFPLDLIWLGAGGDVIEVTRAIPPRRVAACARAGAVVETLAGEAGRFLAAGVGDAIRFRRQHPGS